MDCREGLVKKFGLYLVGNGEPSKVVFLFVVVVVLARNMRIKAN